MKPAFEKPPLPQCESFYCEVVRQSPQNATWHFHPEYQLTLVLQSSGYRLVGDKITPLQAGDLVLLGANLPHVWHHVWPDEDRKGAPPQKVHTIVVQFLDAFFGREFLELPEMQPVIRLLKRAGRGLHIRGKTRDKVAGQLETLCAANGLERIARLLSVLNLLAHSEEMAPIASAGFVPTLSHEDQGRVERVIGFIHQHLAEPINRDAVAAQAAMSIGAFSRFFKQRIGMTLPQYINDLRVGRACRLLAEDKLKVTDLAMDCGFRNLANFNRCFLEITKLTPREYRKKIQSCASSKSYTSLV